MLRRPTRRGLPIRCQQLLVGLSRALAVEWARLIEYATREICGPFRTRWALATVVAVNLGFVV
jgi:hypothetical protein